MGPALPTLSKTRAKSLLRSELGLGRLATIGPNGNPHVVPVWFLYAKRRVYIPSPSSTVKAKNILVNMFVSLVIDSYRGVLDAQGILVQGRARVIKGPESRRINRLIHKKYLGPLRITQRRWKAFMAEDDATIEVRPSRIATWDLSKLKS
jgi:nitroimidazol reductase NimA-like FMN-containing flavoprotein (pyridoxamine 5'-phosphate oxidase superfamily)